jgi:hypothetical protein
MTIIRRVRWTNQPPEATAPVGDIRSGLFLLSQNFSNSKIVALPINVASGNQSIIAEYTDSSGTSEKTQSIFGDLSGINSAGLGFKPNATNFNAQISGTNQCSILLLIRAGGNNNGNVGPFNSRGGTAYAEHYPYSDGNLYLGPLSASSRWVAGVAPGIDLTKPHTAIATHRNGAQAFYLNGRLIASAANAENPAILDSVQSFGGNGTIYLYAAWNRVLSDAEARSVGSDPWQLFEPRRIIIPVGVAAGGADGSVTLTGASSTASAGTLTASGAAEITIAGAGATVSAGTVSAAGTANASVTLTGVGTTASPGTISATGGATATLTGAATTSSAGTPSATGNAATTLAGATTTASAGTVGASAGVSATATLTGASTTSSPGTLSATGGATASLTGAGTTSAASGVTAAAGGSATATITGAGAATSAGTLSAAGDAAATLTGATTTADAGTVSASNVTHASVTLTGASVSATVGALAATGAAQITITGVQITASAGTVTASSTATQDGAVTLTGAGATTSAGTLIAGTPNDAELHAREIWEYEFESGLTAQQTVTAILAALQQGISVGDLARAVWTQELPLP